MKKILNFLTFILMISNIITIIIIPFETINPLLSKNLSLLELIKNTSDKSIVDTLLLNLIYTNLSVGENFEIIPTYLEMKTKYLVIKDVSFQNAQKNVKIKNSNFTFCDNYLMKSIFKINMIFYMI